VRKDGKTDMQTDMKMLIVTFRGFANAPKNEHHSVKCNIITWLEQNILTALNGLMKCVYVMCRLEVINLPAL